jgi:hypothetical protein
MWYILRNAMERNVIGDTLLPQAVCRLWRLNNLPQTINGTEKYHGTQNQKLSMELKNIMEHAKISHN